MIDFIKIVQLAIALSVAYVWIFRFHNVLKEFTSFGLSDLVRNFVGVSKTALSTLLIAGIWYKDLVLVSSVIMGLFMVAAQFFHFKVKNPLQQRLPSLLLLILCGLVAFFQLNTIG
tara:strand:+ start:199 stop:546 length:348 start_codon:yes stop_codon:yes gene_type:complete